MDDAGTLMAKIAERLRQRRWKAAVAESVTGGRLQSLFTSQSGSSDYFSGGITAYGIEQKVRIVGVDQDAATASNGVCERTCAEMASGARRLFGADAAIATSGYAEPSRQHEIDSPFAFIAVNIGESIDVERIELDGDRTAVQDAVAVTALLLFWDHLRRLT